MSPLFLLALILIITLNDAALSTCPQTLLNGPHNSSTKRTNLFFPLLKDLQGPSACRISLLTLADINGVQQPIYLVSDENGNGLIPAPKYYWKLIHDPVTNTATGVVGMNNPFLKTPVASDDIFCNDVCTQIPWVGENIAQPFNIDRRSTFCCTAADLHKAVDFAPDIDVPLFV